MTQLSQASFCIIVLVESFETLPDFTRFLTSEKQLSGRCCSERYESEVKDVLSNKELEKSSLKKGFRTFDAW
jgi:hypothetical protein